MSAPERRRSTASVLAAALLFGTTGAALANAPDGTTALGAGTARLLVGGAVLLVAAVRLGAKRHDVFGFPRTTILGACGVVVFQLCYFVATRRAGVAVGTVGTIGSGPVFSGMLQWMRTKRPPSVEWRIGTALAVLGVGLLATADGNGTVQPVGVLAALAAGLGWATFTSVSKGEIESGRHSIASLATMFAVGGVLTAPLLLIEPVRWMASTRGLSLVLYLGVVTLGLAYVLYGYGLRNLSAPVVITLTLAEPVTATVLAATILHESVRAAGWVGVGFVLLGLVITSVGAARNA